MHTIAEGNKSELQNLVNELIIDSESDREKTNKLLEWFDVPSKNIYNHYRLWKDGNFIFRIPLVNIEVYSTEPYVGIRNYNEEDSLWILTSRFGHCGEYALIFRDMANAANLTVRKITCKGEDHGWDEVLINGTEWIIVDPTAVILPERNGYNLPPNFMEKKVAGDRQTEKGNVSFVYAEYPDGTQLDVTSRYTNLTTITITTLGYNGEPIPNVKVWLISHNRYDSKDTGHYQITNKSGKCTFNIGGGDYTFKVQTNNFIPFYEKTRLILEEYQTYNLTLFLKKDWTKNTILFNGALGILFLSFFVIIGILYCRHSKRRK